MHGIKTTAFTAVLVVSMIMSTVFIEAQSLNDLKNQQNGIQSEKNEAQSNLNEIVYERSELQNEINDMDIEIEKLETDLLDITNQLNSTTSELTNAELELTEASASKDSQMEALIKRLRVMDENGSMTYVQILFSSDDFFDMLVRLENIKTIAEYDRTMFTRLAETEMLIESKVQEIAIKKKETELLLTQQTVKKYALEESAQEKQSKVASLEKDEDLYSSQVADLQAADKEVQALINKEQQQLAEKDAATRAALIKSAQTAAASQNYKGGLVWPLPGYSRLSSGYVNRTNPISGRREFHTGLDLPAPKGTTIIAAGAGVVIYSGNNGNGYGKHIIIDHGGGISTLYGHCSSLSVSIGDVVSAAQVIAGVGSTGYSTGNHLHFEVRINGVHQDPSNYVSP